jgi:hypothetical protein
MTSLRNELRPGFNLKFSFELELVYLVLSTKVE